jgi:hypothetical protein
MALLLRTVRENRWHKEPAAAWLQEEDVPADTLGDLNTTQNALSVWEVEADRSNVERIIRAVALTKDKLAHTGYVIFDSELLSAAGISQARTKGATPDDVANHWHADLTNLSGNRLVALAKSILRNGESGTVLKKRLVELVEAGIHSKELPERFRSKLAASS